MSLVVACARPAEAPHDAQLPAGAAVFSAAEQRAAWCGSTARANPVCEDFREVPIAELVRFEAMLPAMLRKQGFSREAEIVPSYRRLYWAAFRSGRLYVVGSLVCRERLTATGTILLIPTCPLIQVTFPTDDPQRAELIVGG